MGGNPSPRLILIERRQRTLILLSQGLNETEISKQLKVDQSTTSRDLQSLKKIAQQSLECITKEILPFELGRCQTGIDQIIKESWMIFQDNSGKWSTKDRISALKLVKECIRTKVEILLQGPTTLHLQQLQDNVAQLNQKIEEDKDNVAKPTDMLLHKDG